jgi:transcriptional regulator with XRE-family HTH domain
MVAMPSTQRRRDRGVHQGSHLLRSLGVELRTARLAAGVSQQELGRVVGVSGTHVARLERAEVPGASVRLLATIFAVLGMRLSARPYPEGPPIRDVAHARLLARFRVRLPPTVRMRTEVPLRMARDLRAWDGELEAVNGTCKLEAETALHDLQATERRIALKMADDGVDRVILLVADTRRNRRVLREFEGHIRARFPTSMRSVMRELRAGRLPERSGIVVL